VRVPPVPLSVPAEPPSRDEPRRRWGVVALVFGVWTTLGVLAAAQMYTGMRLEGEPTSWRDALLYQLPGWWAWAAATPLVVWLTRRLPLAPPRRALAALAHLGAAVVVSLVHVAVMLAARGIVAQQAPPPTAAFLARYFLGYLQFDLVTYWAIVGAALALAWQREARERERRATRLEAQLAGARLSALRMQLNPHFLFNALNSVAMLVREGDGRQAVGTLASLSDLLRRALDGADAHEVSLREEIAFVERYLEIELVRFQDRLRVRLDLEPAALDARVPNLLLQPLVENAVRHGIARRAAAGLVEITARVTGDRLHLCVRDDGPGLGAPADRLADDGGAGSGVGLANTRARLTELYGADHAFDVRDAEGGGAEAVVVLPYRPAARPPAVAPTPAASIPIAAAHD
jgi:two-component system LytT family sensor kinase